MTRGAAAAPPPVQCANCLVWRGRHWRVYSSGGVGVGSLKSLRQASRVQIRVRSSYSSGRRGLGLVASIRSFARQTDKVHDNLLEVKVNEMIGFSLIGLIIYLYKSKGHGVL